MKKLIAAAIFLLPAALFANIQDVALQCKQAAIAETADLANKGVVLTLEQTLDFYSNCLIQAGAEIKEPTIDTSSNSGNSGYCDPRDTYYYPCD